MERILSGLVVLGLAAALWAADAVSPRERDVAVEKFAREVPGEMTLSTLPKPRSWSHVTTTQSGAYRVVLIGPDDAERELASLDVTVPEGHVGCISVRTSLVVRSETPPGPKERVEP